MVKAQSITVHMHVHRLLEVVTRKKFSIKIELDLYRFRIVKTFWVILYLVVTRMRSWQETLIVRSDKKTRNRDYVL